MTVQIRIGDSRQLLQAMPADSVQCVVTSPPYWGQRDYGVEGQIGLEKTPQEFVSAMVEVFREVHRVLRPDGTCWVNLGDTYVRRPQKESDPMKNIGLPSQRHAVKARNQRQIPPGLKPKDLIGIPWRVAFALQADGWWLRSGVVWHKPNGKPDNVSDRPAGAHEFIFLLTKSERYFYDAEATRVPAKDGSTALKRNVWTVPIQPFHDAHFATFPPDLIEPCIKAGCPDGGIVLDPFGGAGTTGLVADRLGRDAILLELNPKYAAMARDRLQADGGMMTTVEVMAL
jgi:site-specific DNA-methyltransferase (cytosine-N4-specific)